MKFTDKEVKEITNQVKKSESSKLKDFYYAIAKSEAKHYELFLTLAKKYFDADRLAQKKKALTDDQWAKFLVKKASKHFGKVNKQVFQSWIEACGFMKYCEIYKRSYPEAYQAHSCNI